MLGTQMNAARRGVATDEMKLVAKDEDVTLDWLIPKIASGSIIIPSNNTRPQKIHNVGIGKGMKTKVNVNIGTSTLKVNLQEEIEKAKIAVKYHADTIMDLSDGGDVGMIRRELLKVAPITFGTVPIYEAYNHGVEKHKNPMNLTEDDFLIELARKYDVTFSLGDALRPGSILDSHDELQVQEMINIARLTKRAHEKDVQVMVEGPGHVPLNEVAANVRLAKSLIGDVPYYVLGPLVTDVASGHDHIASAIGAAVSASEGVDLLCYLTPSEHLALPNAEEVKAGLIAYRIAAHAGDLVKLREKAIKWDMKMTEARRTLDWEKQIALSIDPEEAARIHGRTGQRPGNNVPCTMCGGACVYVMLPQQRKYEKENGKLQQIE